MSYLVMECHPGYAVVLDKAGRFLKVANLRYQVGQTVTGVIEMRAASTAEGKAARWRSLASVAALAACLCIMLIGARQFLLVPYGSVRMEINPDVQIDVNRLDYVIGLAGNNGDGEDLIEGYSYGRKTLGRVSDELADRALDMGYLAEGGTIRVTVASEHEAWRAETERRILLSLEVHVGPAITVTTAPAGDDAPAPDEAEDSPIVIPAPPRPASPAPIDGEDLWDDDRWDNDDDDRWDDDDDDRWDDDDDDDDGWSGGSSDDDNDDDDDDDDDDDG